MQQLLAVAAGLVLLAAAAPAARADVPLETPGRVERLAQPPDPHWVWISDVLLRRNVLMDLDDGSFLGMVSVGYLSPSAAFPRRRDEFYLPETYYSRGSRGVRTDVVTIYDSVTLSAVDEIEIPPKRAINVLAIGNVALSDDDRFLAVFNMTPATSLSVVDVEHRRFASEIPTPGCSLVYAAGERRFLMLCGDGALLVVEIDDEGNATRIERTRSFFDPQTDPVTEKAVRYRDTWIFVSFEGIAHRVDVSGAEIAIAEPWDLIGASEREQRWRIGGSQHLAVHQGLGRLYSLMHQGGADTHKDPGSELWTYDLESLERLGRISLRPPGYSLLGQTLSFGESWVWPFNRLSDWLIDHVIPDPGINLIEVTQDDSPLLVTGTLYGGSLAVYDARTGAFLRRMSSGNMHTHALEAPWGGSGH